MSKLPKSILQLFSLYLIYSAFNEFNTYLLSYMYMPSEEMKVYYSIKMAINVVIFALAIYLLNSPKKSDDAEVRKLNYEEILSAAIVVLGVYFLIDASSALVGDYANYRLNIQFSRSDSRLFVKSSSHLVQLVLALGLLLNKKKIVDISS